jgi:hypothetical protein
MSPLRFDTRRLFCACQRGEILDREASKSNSAIWRRSTPPSTITDDSPPTDRRPATKNAEKLEKSKIPSAQAARRAMRQAAR